MKQLNVLLMAFSLVGCADVPRPDVDLCIVNAKGNHRICYNMKDDYDSDGRLKSGATAEIKENRDIIDLHKAMLIDSPTGFEDGISGLKSYIKTLREEYKKCRSE